MKIAIVAKVDPTEPRVAATPDTVKKIVALGAEVAVEPGAGRKSGVLDADYAAAGANGGAESAAGRAGRRPEVGRAGCRLRGGGRHRRGRCGARRRCRPEGAPSGRVRACVLQA